MPPTDQLNTTAVRQWRPSRHPQQSYYHISFTIINNKTTVIRTIPSHQRYDRVNHKTFEKPPHNNILRPFRPARVLAITRAAHDSSITTSVGLLRDRLSSLPSKQKWKCNDPSKIIKHLILKLTFVTFLNRHIRA